MRSKETTITRHREILDALADCVQARKDLDTAWNVHYTTIHKALEEGTNAKDLAEQLGVSQSAIYQMAANGQGLDAGLFPPAEDKLIAVPFDGYPNGITVPALLSSKLDVYRADERLLTYAARAHDRNIRHTDIANTIGFSTETVSDLLDRHDWDDCGSCGEQNSEHTELEKALCQEQLLDAGSLSQQQLDEVPP